MYEAAFPSIDMPGVGKLHARFATSLGPIVVVLEEERAPRTVRNFVGLARGTQQWKDLRTHDAKRRRFYDGTTFHRVVPNFMIQGGDRLGTGMGGCGYRFNDEFHAELKHTSAGVLSMASTGPDTNASQFFITLRTCPWLDGVQSVFGAVVEGLDVVRRIAEVPTDDKDRPLKPVQLREVEIFRRPVHA